MTRVKKLNEKVTEMRVKPTALIEDVKVKYESPTGTPPDQQRDIFQGKELENWYTLQDYSVEDGAELHLILLLRG
jgi:hypothetical protein